MSIFGAIGHWFENLFKAIGGQLKVSAEAFLKDFVKDDLGKLAVDAVKFVQAESLHDVDAREAAIAKFKTDAAAAGHDVESFSKSTLNWFIESALQAVLSKLV